MMSGYGVYKYPDGRKYTGEFVNDKMHGKGVYEWGDGRVYDGKFVGGR